MSDETTARFPDRDIGPPSDLVERLVRLADRGPDIEPGTVERVKATIRPAWLAEVRRRSRRRLLRGGAGLAAAAGLITAVALVLTTERPAQQAPSQVATLAVVAGEVEVLSAAGSSQRLGSNDVGSPLLSGSWLRTSQASRAAIVLGDGHSLRLDSESRVRLTSAREVDLDRGAVYLDSGDDGSSGLVVRTSIGVIRDIGTQFEARRAAGTLTVRVREGAVSLTHDSQEIQVAAGSWVEVSGGGLQSGASPPHGPEWAWAQAVAPPFVIEGRRLITFLDWVSRETGLWVSFTDPEVEELAATTVLHGTIDGLGPREAADLVLPGCGLEANVSLGTLTVARQDEPGPSP